MKLNENKKYEKYSREELVSELEELKKKRYGLVWDRKHSEENLDVFVNWENVPENFTPKQFPVLKEVKNKEIETDKNRSINLLIEGDNYYSLAVLNFTHHEAVDVIYIDPPYNTGNKDFIYNDNFVDREDPWRHSKWLSFIEKRLVLAKYLLKDTGGIFISIDNNEIAQLKLLCDEIFGEVNFVNNIIWKKTNSPKAQAGGLGNQHEYVLFYAKDINFLSINKFAGGITKEYKKAFNHDDNDGRGRYQTVALIAGGSQRSEKRKSFEFHGLTDQWLYKKETMEKWWQGGQIYKTSGGQYRLKKYLDEIEGRLLSDIWIDDEIKPLQGGSGEYTGFTTQKPLSLIKRILKLFSQKNINILDFFAGSGTTGHAVLELNKEDGSNRKFILCTNNENNICTDICYPRLQKVIKGYTNIEKEKIGGLEGNLKYLKTDFVGTQPTDKNRRDLVNKSADMICVKEDIFDLVIEDDLNFKIFQKDKKYLGIVFNEGSIASFIKAANGLEGDFIVYCFSYSEIAPEKEFESDMKNKYVIRAIPEIILRVYREIFKK